MAQRVAHALRLGRGEDGFTLIVAMGVLLVASLLTSAAFLAVQSDSRLTRADLNGKQAYAAAQAGIQAYLYQLNSNSISDGWEQCANDVATAVAVPGSTTGAAYSYAPVTQPCATGNEIDTTTGELQLKFTGTAGTGTSSATRTIIASFATDTPLSYLWYTVHETLDPAADNACTGDPFYYNQTSSTTIPTECQLNWITGDQVNGPLYTQDQLLIGAGQAPSFQSVTSDAPSTSPSAVCVNSNCGSATFTNQQTVEGGGQAVNFPTDNSNLLPDAEANGIAPPAIPAGTIDIELEGASALVLSCVTATCTAVQTINLNTTPIIYATNASTCSTLYTPEDVPYKTTTYQGTTVFYGTCGDIYVTGTYSVPVTLAAQNDIVVYGSVTNSTDANGTTTPTGTATLGLVADQYVRVYHPATITNGACAAASASNPNVTIDAAILTLSHSFFVDNYGCGKTPAGTLTVHGAIAQEYRGAVGVTSGNSIYGYLKNYNYDPRLGSILPPYMFDLEDTQWSPQSETLCSPTVTYTVAGACASS